MQSAGEEGGSQKAALRFASCTRKHDKEGLSVPSWLPFMPPAQPQAHLGGPVPEKAGFTLVIRH